MQKYQKNPKIGSMNKKSFYLTTLIFLLSFLGCNESALDYGEREKAGLVPIVEMDQSVPDEGTETVDVAQMLSDLHSQIKALEEGLSGEDPALRESLVPLEKTLNDLKTMLDQSGPSVDKACTGIREIQIQIDEIREGL